MSSQCTSRLHVHCACNYDYGHCIYLCCNLARYVLCSTMCVLHKMEGRESESRRRNGGEECEGRRVRGRRWESIGNKGRKS